MLEQIPACSSDPNKAERILGYASTRLARDKALRLLGTNEEEVALENAKVLGSLGVAGRRRSWSILVHSKPPKQPPFEDRKILRRHTVSSTMRHKMRRGSRTDKHSTSKDKEIRRLRNQARSSAVEIDTLKNRLDELERRLANTGVETSDNT